MAHAVRLALFGAGRMGQALLQGWSLARGQAWLGEIVVVDPSSEARDAAESLGARATDKPERALAAGVDTVVLAVKPQHLEATALAIRDHLPPGVLVISVVAGAKLDRLKTLLPKTRIVRAMPNLPAAVGRGVTALLGEPGVTDGQRERAHALLIGCGSVEEILDESLFDAITAVSGSGPAYVFLMAEALAEAGVRVGLPPDLARRLADATIMGAAEVMDVSGLEPARLREYVTSPGGTTEAALGVLRASDGLNDLMSRAVEAAAWRSRKLAE